MRQVILLAVAVLLLVPVAGADTVANLPLHVQEVDQGVIRVWLGDHQSTTAVMAFATDKGIVVVDTAGNPEVDRQLRQVIARRLGRDDFAYLINTHEHHDHTGGNAVYQDCTIVGHELVAAGMERQAGDLARVCEWYGTRCGELEKEIAALPADAAERPALNEELTLRSLDLKAAQAGGKRVPPHKTFADHLTLDCGDTTFELSYIGGMHSASDIAVWVPEHGLLLTGDTMADTWLSDTPGCLAAFTARQGVPHDFPRLLKNWNELLGKKAQIKQLLPGHWNGELSFAGFADRVHYVEAVWAAAVETDQQQGTLEDLLTGWRLADRFPDLVESPGFNERNNQGTLQEMWTEASGQQSVAVALYELIGQGAAEADIRRLVAARDEGGREYYFMENQINGYGYRFLQTGQPAKAAAMFRINTELYPDSWNVYDSLGEALLATGETAAAERMYLKSLELNPENENGQQMLKKIQAAASVN